MGIYVGPSLITGETLVEIYHASSRTSDLRWTIGCDIWPQILRLTDGEGRRMIDPIRSLGTAVPVTLRGYPIFISDEEPEALRLERSGMATGATVRLPRICRECSDRMPEGATFCITCGAPVETS